MTNFLKTVEIIVICAIIVIVNKIFLLIVYKNLHRQEHMDINSLSVKIPVAVVVGILIGVIVIPLSKKLLLSRTEDPGKAAPLEKLVFKVSAIPVAVGCSVALMLTAENFGLGLRNVLLLLPIFSISIIDALIRKIPNSLLISMVAIQAVYLLWYCISNHTTEIIPTVFLGFFVSTIVCLIPSVLKIPMGAGDIKYSAVIGLCIYTAGYFQAMILMALFVLVYFLYLKITKKGGMKTQIPMGPFLSLGTVITMCFSIFKYISGFFQNIL